MMRGKRNGRPRGSRVQEAFVGANYTEANPKRKISSKESCFENRFLGSKRRGVIVASQFLSGNVFDVLPTLTPGSVDAVCTSPPYWKLRSYLPKGHPLKHLELGNEPTPAEYVSNMVRVFRLVRDAMADHATCWINCGDTYSSNASNQQGSKASLTGSGGAGGDPSIPRRKAKVEIAEGNLCLIPQRLAIALQDDGWVIRSVVIWHKPSPMPASVSGWRWMRCRVKVNGCGIGAGRKNTGHEKRTVMGLTRFTGGVENKELAAQWSDCPGCKKCEPNGGLVFRKGSWRPTSSWEPILMLAKSSSYFCDGESVKVQRSEAPIARDKYTRILKDCEDEQFAVRHNHESSGDVNGGANPRDVWAIPLEDMSKEELIDLIRGMDGDGMPDVMKIASEALKDSHYAAYPTELVFRCLQAATSQKGYCVTCGKPWCRVVETDFVPQDDVSAARGIRGANEQKPMDESNGWEGMPRGSTDSKTIGWRPTCTCTINTPRPGLVLDPFAGSGRTAIQAQRMGLDFVGIDLNPKYVEMAKTILAEQMPLFS